jgi:hypothetical protein
VDLSVLSRNGCAFDFENCVGTGTNDAGECLVEAPGSSGDPEPGTGEPMPGTGTSGDGTGGGSGSGGPRVLDPDMSGGSDDGGDSGGCAAAGLPAAGGAMYGFIGVLFAYWLRRRRQS